MAPDLGANRTISVQIGRYDSYLPILTVIFSYWQTAQTLMGVV